MKLIVLVLLLRFSLWSQTLLLPHDSLIQKHHIKKIKSYYVNRNENKLSQFWEFDTIGNLIQEDFNGRVYHIYENNVRKMSLDYRGEYNHSFDTTFYVYDSRNRLIEKTTTFYGHKYESGPLAQIKLIKCTYDYPNEKMTTIRKEYYDYKYPHPLRQPEIYCDTILYRRDKLILFDTEVMTGTKTTYFYNRRKQLVKKNVAIRRDTAFGSVIKHKFIYKKNQLIREEQQFIVDQMGRRGRKDIFEYSYNNKTLADTIKKHVQYFYNEKGEPEIIKQDMWTFVFAYYYY